MMSAAWALQHPYSAAACEADGRALAALIEARSPSRGVLDELDGEGRAALHYSAWNGLLQPTRALIAAGASVDVRSGDRRSTPLHLACGMNHAAVAHALLRAGAWPGARDIDAWTPLDIARQDLFDNAAAVADVVRVLTACDELDDTVCGTRVHGVHTSVTPLMRACACSGDDARAVATALASVGGGGAAAHTAAVCAVDSHGWSALTWAAARGAASCVAALLAAGADREQQCVRGDTPLAWATAMGRADAAALLAGRDSTDARTSMSVTSGACPA